MNSLDNTYALSVHITQETLDLYVLGQISPEAGDQIEDHLRMCPLCHQAVLQAEWAVSLISAAARNASGLIAAHSTEDGPVALTVRKHGEQWIARIRSAMVDDGSFAQNRDDGVQWCMDSLSRLFPDHQCSAECRSWAEPPAER